MRPPRSQAMASATDCRASPVWMRAASSTVTSAADTAPASTPNNSTQLHRPIPPLPSKTGVRVTGLTPGWERKRKGPRWGALSELMAGGERVEPGLQVNGAYGKARPTLDARASSSPRLQSPLNPAPLRAGSPVRVHPVDSLRGDSGRLPAQQRADVAAGHAQQVGAPARRQGRAGRGRHLIVTFRGDHQ